MAKQIIIGITGTLGAGKGEIVKYLVSKKKFNHFSVSDYLIREIKKRKLPVNRESMRTVANKIRTEKGSGFIVDKLYQKAKKTKKNSIIESIRTLGEVKTLKEKGNFYLFAVDATSKTRFERIKKRQSKKDNVTYDEFLDAERKEMISNDPTKQNLKKCIEIANYKFENNGSFKNLYRQINNALKKIPIKTK